MNKTMFIFLSCFQLLVADSQFSHYDQNNSHSISLAQLQAQYPHLAPSSSIQDSNNNLPSSDRVINLATACYVLFELYKAYEKLYISTAAITENNDSSISQMAKSAVLYCCPQFLISFGTHSQFLVHALTITLTALIYKTIAKLVAFSIRSDLFDLITTLTNRLLKTVKTVAI